MIDADELTPLIIDRLYPFTLEGFAVFILPKDVTSRYPSFDRQITVSTTSSRFNPPRNYQGNQEEIISISLFLRMLSLQNEEDHKPLIRSIHRRMAGYAPLGDAQIAVVSDVFVDVNRESVWSYALTYSLSSQFLWSPS